MRGFIMVKMDNGDYTTKKLIRVEDVKSITQCKEDRGCILNWSGRDIHVWDKFDELSERIALASERTTLLSKKGGNVKIEVR